MGNLNPECALHDPSTYDGPQMQEEPLHSWITWTHNNNIPPSTAKRKYNYPENGSSTCLQNTDHMVSYPRSQYEKLLKKTHKIWNSAGIKRNGWKTWLPKADLPINTSFYCIRKCIQQCKKKVCHTCRSEINPFKKWVFCLTQCLRTPWNMN
jgi:hypothetical protein